MTEPTKTPIHYVDNKEFLAAIQVYLAEKAAAEEQGLPPPKIPNYIGECIMKIATKLSYSPNFINYSYREDMIADGIETCINYFHNFDPSKSSNPFSYFTQIIYYAFLRRIQREKKQIYVRNKMMRNAADLRDLADYNEFDIDGEMIVPYDDSSNEYMNGFIENYEAAMERRKTGKSAKPKKGLENFIEDDNGDE